MRTKTIKPQRIAKVKSKYDTLYGYLYKSVEGFFYLQKGSSRPEFWCDTLEETEKTLQKDDFCKTFGLHPIYYKSFKR